MAWGAIATWRMAHDGVVEALRLLEKINHQEMQLKR